MLARALALSLLVVSCGSSKDNGASKGSASPTAAGDASSLFTGSAPALPAEVAAVKWGGTKADNKAITDSGFLPSKLVKDASYTLGYVVDNKTKVERLDKVSASAQQDLLPILTKAWGKPITVKDKTYWFAPDAGLRATLFDYAKGRTVTFERYESLDKQLGGKGFELAFAKGKPLFGATMAELHAAWGAALCNYDEKQPEIQKAFDDSVKDAINTLRDTQRELWLCQPIRLVSTWDVSRDTIHIGLDGKVDRVSMELPTRGSDELTKQIVAQLDAKFGAATEVKPKDGAVERWYFDPANHMQASARMGETGVFLEVLPLYPVAELVGDASKPGLGVESAHMPGGTFADISKDDAAHFRQTGELAHLIYPATELSLFQTEVDLEFNAGETATYAYRLVVHFTDNDKQGDHIFDLLKAKFGAPKPNAELTKPDDLYFDFAKGGRKLQARRVSQQWQLEVTK